MRCCTAGGKSSSLCSLGNPVPKDWDADGVVGYNWVLFLAWFGLGLGLGLPGLELWGGRLELGLVVWYGMG